MLKICLCSDNHGDMDSLQQVLSENPACDYYLHCGDSQFSPEQLRPFISIEGNNDWNYDFPKQLILEIGGHRILLIHGHGYTYQMDHFVKKARNEHVDVVFFGHTHMFTDKVYSGIRFINPGSTFYNRDLTSPCYARVYFYDDGSIRTERVDL